jgi:Ran GTPase-activating protein (RanGAP) involved in mRNA processing and transport
MKIGCSFDSCFYLFDQLRNAFSAVTDVLPGMQAELNALSSPKLESKPNARSESFDSSPTKRPRVQNADPLPPASSSAQQDEVLPSIPPHDDISGKYRGSNGMLKVKLSRFYTAGASNFVRSMTEMSSLVSLDLSGSDIIEDFGIIFLESLTMLTALKNLDLSHIKVYTRFSGPGHIPPSVWRSLTALRRLNSLNMSNIPLGGDSGVAIGESLITLTALQTLNLSGNYANRKCCSAVGRSLATLTALLTLDLSNSTFTRYDLALFPSLSALTSLQTLNMSGNQCISEELVGTITCLTQLITLKMSDAVADASIIKSLAHLTRLRDLELSLSFCSEDCGVFALLLTTLTALNILDISHSNFPRSSASCWQSLTALTSLRILNLSHNNLCADGSSAVVMFLASLTRLETLDLSHSSLDGVVCVALGQSLTALAALQTLNLSNCTLNACGGAAVGQSLMVLKALRTIDLSCKAIS